MVMRTFSSFLGMLTGGETRGDGDCFEVLIQHSVDLFLKPGVDPVGREATALVLGDTERVKGVAVHSSKSVLIWETRKHVHKRC